MCVTDKRQPSVFQTGFIDKIIFKTGLFGLQYSKCFCVLNYFVCSMQCDVCVSLSLSLGSHLHSQFVASFRIVSGEYFEMKLIWVMRVERFYMYSPYFLLSSDCVHCERLSISIRPSVYIIIFFLASVDLFAKFTYQTRTHGSISFRFSF